MSFTKIIVVGFVLSSLVLGLILTNVLLPPVVPAKLDRIHHGMHKNQLISIIGEPTQIHSKYTWEYSSPVRFSHIEIYFDEHDKIEEMKYRR
jgi:hypothetical protein